MPTRERFDPVILRVACPSSEFDVQFLQGMLNRTATSFHKYGEVHDAFPDKVDALASLVQRIDAYRESGNTEFLIDAANFAMFEFMCPSRAGAHFAATDSDASPGRTAADGGFITNERNDELEAAGGLPG